MRSARSVSTLSSALRRRRIVFRLTPNSSAKSPVLCSPARTRRRIRLTSEFVSLALPPPHPLLYFRGTFGGTYGKVASLRMVQPQDVQQAKDRDSKPNC